MKNLLAVTALFEAATGLALLVKPSLVASLLLGASLGEPSGILVARICGAALVSLSIACWLSKDNAQASAGIVKALMVYNISVALLLSHAGLVEDLSGLGLWPVVLLHGVLLVWCVQSVRSRR
jgi:hypothetical protein